MSNNISICDQDKKWRLSELCEIINDFEANLEKTIKTNNIVETEDLTNIFLHIAGKTVVTSREIICLIANGFADGAFALSRTVYEHFVIINFLFDKQNSNEIKSIVNDYYLDYYISANRALKYSAKTLHYDDLLKKISDEESDIKNKANHQVKGDYWWSEYKTFADLAKSIQHKNLKEKLLYVRAQMLYKQACLSLHSNCFGNYWRLEAGTDYNGINTGPSENGHGLPLELLTCSLISIICETCIFLKIDYISYRNKLNELALFYVNINNKNGDL